MIELEQATMEHARAIAAHLRPDAEAEILAEGYPSAIAGLQRIMSVSTACWALRAEGELVAIFGYSTPTLIGRLAMPWAVTSTAADRHSIAVARFSRRFIALLREEFDDVRNVVDARYARSLTWLRWLGFKVAPPVPMPPTGRPFHPIALGS